MKRLEKFKYYAEWSGIIFMGIIGIGFVGSFVAGLAYILCKLFKIIWRRSERNLFLTLLSRCGIIVV